MLINGPLAQSIAGADVLIHVGVGGIRDLPALLELTKEKRVFLIEAIPNVARDLQLRTRNRGNVTVLSAAVSSAGGDRLLLVHSLETFSSLRKPTGLTQLYPGLRLAYTVPVQCKTGAEILTMASREDEQTCLMLSFPGEELALLQNLADTGCLLAISAIVVRFPLTEMFEEAGGEEEIIQLLGAHGFDPDEIDRTDPDFPVVSFRLNAWRLKHAALAKQFALAQKQMQHDQQKAQEEEREGSVDAVRHLKQECERLSTSLNEKEQELTQVKRDLSIALRLQILRENDLRDLQQRYSSVLDLKRRQQDLLLRLKYRLDKAADCLTQLRLDSGPDLNNPLTRQLVHVLSGDEDSDE